MQTATAPAARTAGQQFTAEIRKMMAIGPRTRWYRRDNRFTAMTREAIVERVITSIQNPGYDGAERTAAFRPAFAALLAYDKHVEGFRIDGRLRFRIMDMTPWQFAAFLGEMVDSGCTNNGQFERWFADQARAAVQIAA